MKLLVANWKMNPASVAEATALAKATDYEGVVLCPPFPFLGAVGETIKKATLGAQDVFWQDPVGPFTGEISATELKSLGVQYVIIGHSERRRLGETDEIVGKKVAVALGVGLTPIACVGETAEEKSAGKKEGILSRQLAMVFSQQPAASSQQPIYIAYEPVWAISTNRDIDPERARRRINRDFAIDTPANAVSTIDFLKEQIVKLGVEGVNPAPFLDRDKLPRCGFVEKRCGVNRIKFLYGGSVTAATASGFLQESAIDGALVGGAGLKPEEMLLITKYL